MVQMVETDSASTAPTGVVTVAELLSRYAPVPVDPEPVTVPVSVGSLLRREGRAPHAADRPLQPRDRQEDEPRRGVRVVVRRGAVAAGALLAAGAVFGAAVVDDASGRSDGTRGAQTGDPGQGGPEAAATAAGAVPTVVDQAAQSDQLDAGVDAPSSWMSTAFGGDDTTGGTASAATDPTGSPTTAPSPAPGGGPVTGETGPRSDAPSVRDDANRDRTVPPGRSDDGRAAGDVAGDGQDSGNGGLGDAVTGVGDGVGGPVGGTVAAVGGAVDGVGDTMSDADDGSVVGTLAGLAGGLL